MGFNHNIIKYQVNILLSHKNKFYSLEQIRELFKIAKSTYIKDTWLYRRGFIENIEHGTWKIKGFQ